MFARFPQALCAIFSKPTISWLVGSRPPQAEYRGREAIHKKFLHEILLFQSITISYFNRPVPALPGRGYTAGIR
jgi:hypothetical protein